MDNDAFAGIRVVELAQWVFVPVAGALLADWGADVVRVEHPDGDPYRGLATQGIGTDSGGVNLSLALANRGKRSIALDLRTARGREILDQLLETADVFLTSLRPGALRRLGLDAEQLTARFPRLVYGRGHGYGTRGPDADRPGYDSSAFWAQGGMAHVLTPPEAEYPLRPAVRWGPQRRDGPGIRVVHRAAATRAHRQGFGGRCVPARHRDVDAVLRYPLRSRGGSRAECPGAAVRSTRSSVPTGPRTRGTSNSSSYSRTGTGPTSAV